VKVTGKIKSKLKMRGSEGMFVGYARDGTADTHCIYLPGTNSIHEMRDVQWGKQMYFEPEKGNLVHAVDSVELIANNHIVPLRTTVLATIQQMDVQQSHQGSGKGHVQFDKQVEYMPKSNKYESKVDEDLNEGYERPIRAPRMIEFKQVGQHEEETWSTISRSVGRNRWNVNTAQMHLLQQDEVT
jgi:hypothetical protein